MCLDFLTKVSFETPLCRETGAAACVMCSACTFSSIVHCTSARLGTVCLGSGHPLELQLHRHHLPFPTHT
jgi:hypothetical protein